MGKVLPSKNFCQLLEWQDQMCKRISMMKLIRWRKLNAQTFHTRKKISAEITPSTVVYIFAYACVLCMCSTIHPIALFLGGAINFGGTNIMHHVQWSTIYTIRIPYTGGAIRFQGGNITHLGRYMWVKHRCA